jgi:MFS superfamily sulfate permease-like transporter
VRGLISPAITVAMLGAIESLMSAVVADRMSGDQHNPNVELMAQGIANILSPLFGGLPATGAIFRIHGPFLFGATEKIDEIRRELASLPLIVVLRLRNMTAIDSTGLQALQRLAEEVRASGRTLLLCGAREQPARLMAQASFAQHVGEENICPRVSAAIERARAVRAEDLAREVLI